MKATKVTACMPVLCSQNHAQVASYSLDAKVFLLAP